MKQTFIIGDSIRLKGTDYIGHYITGVEDGYYMCDGDISIPVSLQDNYEIVTRQPQFRVIIAGSCSFNDYDKLKESCDNLLFRKRLTHSIVIISGTAIGADTLGEKYAHERGYALRRFPADWRQYGKAAGPIRNRQMAENADGLICFWNGHSLGAKNMIQVANKKGLKVRTIIV